MEVDIALKRLKIAVEWDGSYWHRGRNANEKDNRKNDLLISKGWKFIRVNDTQLSREEVEYRCDVILWLIEKYKNSNDFNYTCGFYI